MAAPTPTVRITPSGRILENGYKTLITFSRDPDVEMWEISVKPIGMDGGPKIDLTNMHSAIVREYAPRRLMEMTDGQMTVHYDPKVLPKIMNDLINRNNVITETYSDGSTYAYWGYLQKFERNEHGIDGDAPQGTATFVVTNRDDSGVRQLPVETDVTGT